MEIRCLVYAEQPVRSTIMLANGTTTTTLKTKHFKWTASIVLIDTVEEGEVHERELQQHVTTLIKTAIEEYNNAPMRMSPVILNVQVGVFSYHPYITAQEAVTTYPCFFNLFMHELLNEQQPLTTAVISKKRQQPQQKASYVFFQPQIQPAPGRWFNHGVELPLSQSTPIVPPEKPKQSTRVVLQSTTIKQRSFHEDEDGESLGSQDTVDDDNNNNNNNNTEDKEEDDASSTNSIHDFIDDREVNDDDDADDDDDSITNIHFHRKQVDEKRRQIQLDSDSDMDSNFDPDLKSSNNKQKQMKKKCAM